MKKYHFKKISLIGIGLIGSSIALAVKKSTKNTYISLFDNNYKIRQEAKKIGLGNEVSDKIVDCVKKSELVILSVPVGSMKSVMEMIAPHLDDGTIITDTGSTKSSVYKDITPFLPKKCFFIGGHPLAGTEFSGPNSGFPSLFQGRYWLIIPEDNPEKEVKKVENFCKSIGAMTERMDLEYHDKVIALTSHLPHLIAFTIVRTAANLEQDLKNDVIRFSASGFRDFTRIASSDPIMWRDIFLNNEKSILEMLKRFNDDLDFFQTCIKSKQGEKLLDLFTKTREIRKSIVDARQDVPEENKAKRYFKYSRNSNFTDGQ